MAALAAMRANKPLKAFAQRLEKAGKPKRLILTAIARKLVVIANAVLKANLNTRQLT
jgi:transposase